MKVSAQTIDKVRGVSLGFFSLKILATAKKVGKHFNVHGKIGDTDGGE